MRSRGDSPLGSWVSAPEPLKKSMTLYSQLDFDGYYEQIIVIVKEMKGWIVLKHYHECQLTTRCGTEPRTAPG